MDDLTNRPKGSKRRRKNIRRRRRSKAGAWTRPGYTLSGSAEGWCPSQQRTRTECSPCLKKERKAMLGIHFHQDNSM